MIRETLSRFAECSPGSGSNRSGPRRRIFRLFTGRVARDASGAVRFRAVTRHPPANELVQLPAFLPNLGGTTVTHGISSTAITSEFVTFRIRTFGIEDDGSNSS